ncbi:MAG: FHA domain-containing protein [Candidatus Symbiothrix sp.]|jgi:hypothetical protein|nr:FHA domain-containing protein [Candidatus Symbiothrix sp.]
MFNKTTEATDAVTFRNDLLETIVKTLRPQAFADNVDGSYILYVAGTDDDLNYQAEVNKPGFKKDLLLALEHANITVVANVPWTIKTTLPPKEATGSSEVKKGVCLQYVKTEEEVIVPAPVPSKAKVSIWHDKGSLVKESYRLDSSKRKSYNVGRGEFNDKTGLENHIAINDHESNTEKSELNACVSRTHAKIVFEEEKGFCLQVLPGGSKLATGNSTKIRHGEDSIVEAQNLNLNYPLSDGDIIELGRKVLLKFETIKKSKRSC